MIGPRTKAGLRARRLHARETYDQVIDRLLEDTEEIPPAVLRRWDRIVKQVKAGDFQTLERVGRGLGDHAVKRVLKPQESGPVD
jgi:hypothetical protein